MSIFRKFVEKNQVSLQSGKNNGNLHEDQHKYFIISRRFLLEIKKKPDVRVNVTFRRLRATIIAMGKQYYIFGVCVCSFVNQCACAVLLSVASLAVPYFPTLFHKWYDFQKEFIELEMCVLIFSTTSV